MGDVGTTALRRAPGGRGMVRLVAALFAVAAAFTAPSSSAEPTPPAEAPAEVRVECERASDVGRVRCTAELRVAAGRSVRWADVVITSLPPFAVALKGRLGPDEAVIHEPSFWRFPFAVAARAAGEGAVEARVRFVECGARAVCEAREVQARGALVVGR